MNLHDCTCIEGRKPCACGKVLCQKNSDGSDPHTEDDINPFATQALAIALALKATKPCNSDCSDPNVAGALSKLGNEPPRHWGVQALAIAVAAMVVSMLTGFALGAAARHLGWVS